jgi:hypothetical protein
MTPAEEKIQAFFKEIANKWYKEDEKINRYTLNFFLKNLF